VNFYFDPIHYQTGPMIFGEPGTNGQHSFFQKLHQGSDVIPVQFIGFAHPQIQADMPTFGSTSQAKLLANLIAQIVALAVGKEDANANKCFSGNRPTSLVYAKQLTPQVLGALLAFYENAIMFTGFLLNINSFDQEGVQLGKKLAQEVLANQDGKNPVLASLLKLIS
jgi:glucose-6-phosphate isomerase